MASTSDSTDSVVLNENQCSYEELPTLDVEQSLDEDPIVNSPDHLSAQRTMWNFILMSVLFSANHGSVVSCMGLATARLGSTGAIQNGILFFSYTTSALLGSTYITKRAGSRKALLYGMGLYCIYVSCFWFAILAKTESAVRAFAWGGAAIGGIGAGFLWTAQGSYFGQAAEEHAEHLNQSISISTASLAGVFAFLYLVGETVVFIEIK